MFIVQELKANIYEKSECSRVTGEERLFTGIGQDRMVVSYGSKRYVKSDRTRATGHELLVKSD